ncbi:bifunctional 2-polyprenyl-6-hydroxyphenol methylase/3-demethylubiquinol 3-O-methyltransferase UbiG [Colwellia sp. MB02u-6]|uniref:bifunctional 2-polyprenyl-6-hydroxyphenol methylase/3-demethylubiquinol 3-O-methyltransferase UbiG n=1 Tax=Colwellia sp. MB02u-6 TaxID=2759824 RepID=UPI0015F3E80E|nr:bifunctional 2-polyprenyl-6-hydroxyphenol methylase/3-demethylubiquinol 3-O-methyltransferase UbiG [Colwellia sp. MB02u-6]MBA6326453.1 bifunctional 2-polyprenyl-6-hydroxyphenol methylase/3-demethylubiquinol 3-O-methyltransferase UbiG [Colwellia sp. MB02u-6]
MLDKSKLNPVQNDSTERTSTGNYSLKEIAKFDKLAESWWDSNGQYKTALEFNRVRVAYFIAQICKFYHRDPNKLNPLQGLHILDVGCGGGLVCEPLAKAGATVVGIDVSEMSIEVAKRHALTSQLDIEYRHEHAQHTSKNDENRYDVVINAEVIEHIPNQQDLLKQCSQLCKVNGCVIMATLNRTIKSYLVAIVGAEYIMRYLPIGTHSWHAFVKPIELNNMAENGRLQLVTGIGMTYNLFTKTWSTTSSLAVNYVQVYQRLTPD